MHLEVYFKYPESRSSIILTKELPGRGKIKKPRLNNLENFFLPSSSINVFPLQSPKSEKRVTSKAVLDRRSEFKGAVT